MLLTYCVAFYQCSCRSSPPGVLQMTYPVYPVTAQCQRVEGDVDLIVKVGVDGKVLSVLDGADAPNANRDLRDAAKENARQWTWGPFPPRFQFPWYHNIRYGYKIEGHPTGVPAWPAIIRTDLPNRIDIVARPCTVSPLALSPVTSPAKNADDQ